MSSVPPHPAASSTAISMAMVCSGAVMAQFIGGRAARDALYLANMDAATTLPTMVIAAAAVSLALVAVSARITPRVSPGLFVPALFMVSAVLLVAEWVLTYRAPRVAAVVVYLHVSGLGPLLGSGFWLVASERFDPRTAKRRFGQIQGAGTFGGLVGGLIAERVAAGIGVAAILPVLALTNIVCAWAVGKLATGVECSWPREMAPDLAPEPARSGLRVLAERPYLRNLAIMVVLGTVSAGLLDYLFKVEASRAFGQGDNLLRFFAVYYATTSAATFLLQAVSSRFALSRLGLAWPASAPSCAVVAGGLGALLSPSAATMVAARGSESLLRGSWFRAAYEIFFTPVAPSEKRAAKSIIDVGADRFGDAIGGGIILLIGMIVRTPRTPILLVAIVVSAVAIVIARSLKQGYVDALADSLQRRAVDFDLAEIQDRTTNDTLVRSFPPRRRFTTRLIQRTRAVTQTASPANADPEIQQIVALRSRDQEHVQRVLRDPMGIPAPLVPHVIALLAWDPAANDAIFALRKVAEEHVGAYIDALINPNEDFAVRRRLARVFSVCVSQRAVDGLLLGLDDLRFEVRFQCGRSLVAIVEKNALIHIDHERIFSFVLREVTAGKTAWEARRIIDTPEPREGSAFVDEFVRERAGQSLAHVFTLLSLALPREPLQVAFRGLYTEDVNLRGTSLEYLEEVLPPDIRDGLWPFLEDRRGPPRTRESREEIVADLLRANQSIVLNLEELKRAHDERIRSKQPTTS